jgi:sec-independent protein translocase protein TatA
MFRNPTTDLIVVLVIVLVIFGPKRLPGLGKSLGQGFREFKDGITGKDKDDEQRPALSESSGAPVQDTAAPVQSSPEPVHSPPEPERQSAEVGSEQRS